MGYRDGNWDVPDPGSQEGPKASRLTLKCTRCAWSHSGRAAHAEAQAHHAATGHPISFRGTVQAWSAQPIARAQGAA